MRSIAAVFVCLLHQVSPYSFRGMMTSRKMQMTNEADAEQSLSIKILALHGKGSDGESFARQMQPLEAALLSASERLLDGHVSFEFDYPTAPYGLGDDGDGRAWWTLRPGERSFTAREYIGYEQSATLVENKLCQGPGFDFVIGHSQGAILLSSLLASSDRLSKQCFIDNKGGGGESTTARNLRGFVFNGSAWPNPNGRFLDDFQVPVSPKPWKAQEALFVIGTKDSINPPEGAERVRQSFAGGGLPVQTVEHGGGHSFPTSLDPDSLEKIAEWFIYRVLGTVK